VILLAGSRRLPCPARARQERIQEDDFGNTAPRRFWLLPPEKRIRLKSTSPGFRSSLLLCVFRPNFFTARSAAHLRKSTLLRVPQIIEDVEKHEQADNAEQIIKSCRTSAGELVTITIWNQSLAHNLARTEALCRSSEKARIGRTWARSVRHIRRHTLRSV
jgi:hypothetical protein